MKNLTLSEFMNNLVAGLSGVTQEYDIVRVESERSDAFVVMEEAQYEVMRDALRTAITPATFEEPSLEAVLVAAKRAGLVKER